MSALGQLSPDPWGQILKSPFIRFLSPGGLDGLIKVSGTHLDILAVHTFTPGHGQFRTFINDCKREFETIRLLEVWNSRLARKLKKYGFEPFIATEDGEQLSGYRWQRS